MQIRKTSSSTKTPNLQSQRKTARAGLKAQKSRKECQARYSKKVRNKYNKLCKVYQYS